MHCYVCITFCLLFWAERVYLFFNIKNTKVMFLLTVKSEMNKPQSEGIAHF